MLRKFRFVLAGILIIVVNQAVTYAVSAAQAQSLLAPGTTRYAVVSTTSSTSTTSGTWADLAGLVTNITVPSGKHGDVIILFCGDSNTQSVTSVRAKVGGYFAAPSASEIRYNPPAGGSESRCANFYLLNVPAGTRAVKVQWAGTSGQYSWMFSRSMIVLVNMH